MTVRTSQATDAWIAIPAGTASDQAGNPLRSSSQRDLHRGQQDSSRDDQRSVRVVHLRHRGVIHGDLFGRQLDTSTLTAANIVVNKTGSAMEARASRERQFRTVTIANVTGDGTLSISLSRERQPTSQATRRPPRGGAAFTVDNALPVTSALTVSGTRAAFSYAITASESPATFATGLPGGSERGCDQWHVSGTATETGNFSVALRATDAVGNTGAATLAKDRQFTLTVTANDASRAYGSANPVFTGTLTGVRNSDGMTATYNTTANASSRRFLSDHRDLADRITNWAITTWSTVPAS